MLDAADVATTICVSLFVLCAPGNESASVCATGADRNREDIRMRVCQAALSILIATFAGPALSKEQIPPMKVGDVVAVPDGHMARATVDAKKMDEMKKIAKEIPWCMMFVMGADGSVYKVDTSSHAPMVDCENMAQ
jgi:hypothetical protein